MIYYTVDNPTTKPVQEWDIPQDSIVYVALKPNAFTNLHLRRLLLDDGEENSSKPQRVQPNRETSKITEMNDSGTLKYYDNLSTNRLTLAKMWMGSIPFRGTVNGTVFGFTQTIDGTITKTVNRYSYVGTDGNTYYFDNSLLMTIDWSTLTGYSGWETNNVYLGIVRDSNLNILNCGSFWGETTKRVVIGRRNYQVQIWSLVPNSLIQSSGADIVPMYYVFGEWGTNYYYEITLSPGEATSITSIGTVEITDCPNITYTFADPLTVPITINCTDKSYCYIQF